MLNNQEVNALEFLQIIPSNVLSQFVLGKVDINKLLKLELSYRGLDTNGQWVGFEEAEKIHQIGI